ncbi:hypothetical protein DIPPA_26019 [Diplonema papillatum]|nr:hypothetical protein DIPPA_26019 [Diplonema papillatum]
MKHPSSPASCDFFSHSRCRASPKAFTVPENRLYWTVKRTESPLTLRSKQRAIDRWGAKKLARPASDRDSIGRYCSFMSLRRIAADSSNGPLSSMASSPRILLNFAVNEASTSDIFSCSLCIPPSCLRRQSLSRFL